MPQVTQQSSFNLGQIDDEFAHRVDEDMYWKAALKLENMFVTEKGGVVKRPGFIQHTDLTDLIAGRGSPTFFTQYLYTPNQSMVRVVIVVIGTTLYASIYQDNLDFQAIALTGYTPAQVLDIKFVVVRNSVLLLHKAVAPHRIVYDSNKFTFEPFVFSNPATFDLQQVDYSTYKVDITPGTNPGDATLIVIKGFKFPSPNNWVNGMIIGPGQNINAPFGVGRIDTVAIVSADTHFSVLPSVPFEASATNTIYKGSDLSIQQPIFNNQLGYPSNGHYFQNRLWFIGHPAVPTTIFGTALGTQNDLAVGSGEPADAIVYHDRARLVSERGGEGRRDRHGVVLRHGVV